MGNDAPHLENTLMIKAVIPAIEINAIESGNIKTRDSNWNAIILVICGPNRKRVRPTIRKKREQPDTE